MGTPARPEKPTPPGYVPPSGEVTVFLKPSFGITIQSNTLCVAVSATPKSVDTQETPGAATVDESIPCP